MKRLLTVIPLALLFLPSYARPQSPGPQGSPGLLHKTPPDLTGKWKTTDGRQVIIGQIGQHLHATFAPGSDKCANGGTLRYVLDGDLSGASWTSLSGTMTACTQDQKLVKDCGWSQVWETTFNGTATLDKISAKVVIMGVSFGTQNGHYVHCRVDHRYDIQQDVVLIRDCDLNRIAALKRDEAEAEKEAATLLQHSLELLHERTKKGKEDFKELADEAINMLGLHAGLDIGIEDVKKSGLEGLRRIYEDPMWAAPTDVTGVLKTNRLQVKLANLVLLFEFAKFMYNASVKLGESQEKGRQAEEELARGGELLQRGAADFRTILDLLAACRKEREKEEKKLRDLEDLNDRAHKLMDKWDLGTGLYHDGSGQTYDSGAALNHAKQILLSGQSSHLRIDPFRVQLRLVLVAQAQAPQQEITVTVQQLTDALAEIKRAESLFSQGMDKIAQAAKLDEEIQKGLEDLVSRLGAAPDVASSNLSPLGPLRTNWRSCNEVGMLPQGVLPRLAVPGFPGWTK